MRLVHAQPPSERRHPAPLQHTVGLGFRERVLIGIDHVQLAAPPGCEPEARRFFGELLGMQEIEKPPALRDRGGVWFAAGEQQLHVGVEQGFTSARKAHPAFRVAPGRLTALAERLQSAGVEVVWDEALPGAWRFYFVDPWGNRLELLERE